MNDQLLPGESDIILDFAAKCLDIDGDFVELGCYRGDTSVLLGKLLQKYNQKIKNSPALETALFDAGPNWSLGVGPLSPRKGPRLWIYDSFAGLPAKTAEDSSGAGANFKEGELLVSKREVIDKLKKHGIKNTIVKKAWFNELTDQDLPPEIAFAFCDGDLYSSIKTSLDLVLPRLTERGTIVVHDYNNPELPGSARAVDEFLHKNPNFRLQVRKTLAILSQS